MSRGFSAIGLDNPKFSHNLGGVLRACGCYGSSLVVVSGFRMKRTITDVNNQWKKIPILETTNLYLTIPFGCIPVAVDRIPGATSLVTYVHPERAFYIFGSEDSTLGRRITDWCRDKIYVPTYGCMNLASTVNVILYDRMVKRGGEEIENQFPNDLDILT